MAKQEKDYTGVIRDYINGMSPNEIADKYNLNDGSYVYYILKKNNINTKRNKWTETHTELLKAHYPLSDWNDLLEILKPFPKDTITHKAHDFGITRTVGDDYSQEELDIMKKYYNKMTTKELLKLLPYRTESGVNCKACNLGLVSREKWSDDDTLKLIEEYPVKTNKELSNIFQRTPNAIMAQGLKLGLKKDLDEHLYISYDEEKLINDLKEFAQVLGRTPLSNEVNENKDMAHSNTYRRCFNNYVDACQKAGLEPNYEGNIFCPKTYRSKNNDLCLSQPELIITNLFIDNDIPYEKETYYSVFTDDIRCGYKRCDWFLSNENGLIIEFFGMEKRESYKKRMVEKQIICNDNNLILLELYPKDMKNGLEGLLKKFREHGIILNNK